LFRERGKGEIAGGEKQERKKDGNLPKWMKTEGRRQSEKEGVWERKEGGRKTKKRLTTPQITYLPQRKIVNNRKEEEAGGGGD